VAALWGERSGLLTEHHQKRGHRRGEAGFFSGITHLAIRKDIFYMTLRKIAPYAWLLVIDMPLLAVFYIVLPCIILFHALMVYLALLLWKIHVVLAALFFILYSLFFLTQQSYDGDVWPYVLFFALFPVWSAVIFGILCEKRKGTSREPQR